MAFSQGMMAGLVSAKAGNLEVLFCSSDHRCSCCSLEGSHIVLSLGLGFVRLGSSRNDSLISRNKGSNHCTRCMCSRLRKEFARA